MNVSASENFGMAIGALWSHRFRSLLTILGIVIGITTVVTVSSLLTGVRKGVVTFFQEMGPDNIFIFKTSGDPSMDGPIKERKRRPLRPEYAETVRSWCPAVEDVGLQLYIPAVVDGNPLTARVPGFEADTINVAGQSPNVISLSPRDLASGRYFTPEEDQRGAHVAVIGFSLAEALFPTSRAVGRTMMMDGAEYTIVGVFDKAKGGFFGENSLDNIVVLPLRTTESRYPQVNRFMVIAKARTGQRQEAYYEIEAALRRVRRVPKGAADDFSLSTPDQIIQQFDRITGLIGMVAIAISGLGLLVGGIGVMNIMLVSVTERTREIGVRKALGARSRDIIGQFLIEAMALTGVGGLLGLVIAVIVTLLVGALVPSLPSEVPVWALTVGFSVSVLVGLFFGVWPATKAARLDPVDALRYE